MVKAGWGRLVIFAVHFQVIYRIEHVRLLINETIWRDRLGERQNMQCNDVIREEDEGCICRNTQRQVRLSQT